MATTAMDYENPAGDRFDDEAPRYERDNRSASPRSEAGGRRRSASPGAERAPVKDEPMRDRDDDGAVNPGSNLFVTGIHPRLLEEEVTRLFTKYGTVEKCQIMRDPHTKESRGFGFVKMITSEEADAAKEGLQGKEFEGRTLSIEKARRARPRTPTPGKYFGPPKEPRGRFGGDRYGDDRRRGGGYGGGGPRGGDRYRDRYRDRDDRGARGYGGGGDRGYGGGYEDRAYDRGYDRGYDREDRGGGDRGGDRGGYDRRGGGRDYEDRGGGGGIDRYAGGGGGRDDRYSSAPRGGGGGGGGAAGGSGFERGYDRGAERAPRDAAPPAAGYSDTASRGEARETYGGTHDDVSYRDPHPTNYGRD